MCVCFRFCACISSKQKHKLCCARRFSLAFFCPLFLVCDVLGRGVWVSSFFFIFCETCSLSLHGWDVLVWGSVATSPCYLRQQLFVSVSPQIAVSANERRAREAKFVSFFLLFCFVFSSGWSRLFQTYPIFLPRAWWHSVSLSLSFFFYNTRTGSCGFVDCCFLRDTDAEREREEGREEAKLKDIVMALLTVIFM